MHQSYFSVVWRAISFAPRYVNNEIAPAEHFVPEDSEVMSFVVIQSNPDKNKVHRERWAKLNFKQLTNEVEFLDIPRAAAPTVVNHIEVLGGFFTFCKERRYMEHSSPLLARIKKKAIDKDQPKRRGFSADDLLQIFDLDTYQSRNYPHSFWPPLIALLTGARCNEIAQLYLDDIVNDDSAHPDRWRIMIRKPRPDQRLKNKFSNRSIPIHPRLIELGFLHYLDDVRALGFERVFPALRYTEAAGYGDTVSDMFSGYLRNKVKITDPLKEFHSFRHYFCTQALNQTQHEMLRIYDITGHEREGEFALTYARELHYENKMAILMDIPLPKMELPIYRPGMFTAKLLATKMKKASEAAEASRLARRTPAEVKKDEAAAAVKASSVKRDPKGFTIKVSKPRKPKEPDLFGSTGHTNDAK